MCYNEKPDDGTILSVLSDVISCCLKGFVIIDLKAKVKYSVLHESQQIFVSKYITVLLTIEELQKELERNHLIYNQENAYGPFFISLRSYFETALFGVQLSANELNFRLWKSESLDLYWSQITNENDGIFASKFVGAFAPLFCKEALYMRKIAVEVYRECSEFIHNNYGATTRLPKATQFDQEIFNLLGNKVESINQVIMFVFTMRYMELIRKKEEVSEFEEPIMDSIGYLTCVQEIYR